MQPLRDWTIKEFTESNLKLQLYMDDPEQYTTTMFQSYIRINFYTAELLTSKEGNKQIPFRL